MSKQFPNVNSRYGAPMGRPESRLSLDLERPEKNIRLFKVNLDSGGYDDGGAYWGLSDYAEQLFCAQDYEGGQEFVRASSRLVAAAKMGLSNDMLRRGIPHDEVNAYFRSWVEGRLPPSLHEEVNWLWWFAANGCKVFKGQLGITES